MVSTNDEVINEVSTAEVQSTIPADMRPISEDEFEKAQKTFQLGKKNLFLNKFDESVNNIGEACKIYSSKYGEFDPRCAEVYFFYGRALLELARVESTVLGNALTGVPEDTEPIDDSRYGNPEDIAAEEKKDISEKVIDALCERETPLATESNNTVTETQATEPAPETTIEQTSQSAEEKKEIENNTIEQKDQTAAEEEENDVDEEDEEDGDVEAEDLTKTEEQAKEEAEADEISNLQRSWEMFELAKLVYSKNFDNDLSVKNKRIAECLLKLGEISIEQEIYDQAITDITESIRLQEEQKEDRDERMLAESYYQLGLAQQFNNLFNEANESYQKSINIMQLRIEKLKGRLELATDIDESERTTMKDEITELEALLPEMTAKLEEVNDQGQQSLSLIKEAKECFINNINTEVKINGVNGEIKDITSLVKSKRKLGAAEEETNLVKKTRLSGSEELVLTTTSDTPNIEMTETNTVITENLSGEPIAETNTSTEVIIAPAEPPIESSAV